MKCGKNELRFGRLIPAMVTPFDKQGEVDFALAGEMAVWQAEMGSSAVVICGTTGEGPTITKADKLKLFSTVLEALEGRIPVIANVGNYNTAESVEFAKEAEAIGVQGLMAVIPYYNKPPQEGLYQHFGAIASAVDIPIVMYNIPGRCSINMTAETSLRLARDFENIAAIKEASGKFDQIQEIIDKKPEGFAVYSGDDSATLPIMKLGGTGVITTAGNCAPKQMGKIVELCAAGDWEAAQKAHDDFLPVMEGLFKTTNPILVKAACQLIGFPVGGVRLPLVPATEEQIAELKATLIATGVIDG